MKKTNLNLKDILKSIPIIIGTIIIFAIWSPIVIYKSFKNSSRN